MTHDLGDKFAVLTDDRPEPLDPAAVVRSGIRRRVRRRRATAGVLTTAAVTAIALTAAPVAGALLNNDTPTAGGTTPTGSKETYLVAEGQVGGKAWRVEVDAGGCLWSGDGKRPWASNTDAGRDPVATDHCPDRGITKLAGRDETPKGSVYVLAAAVPASADTVRITAGKHTFDVATVVTPASQKYRFVAISFRGDFVGDWSVSPLGS